MENENTNAIEKQDENSNQIDSNSSSERGVLACLGTRFTWADLLGVEAIWTGICLVALPLGIELSWGTGAGLLLFASFLLVVWSNLSASKEEKTRRKQAVQDQRAKLYESRQKRNQ